LLLGDEHMSNESEIGKEMSKEGKLIGNSITSQNKVQVEQIAKDSSMTVLGVSSSNSGNSMEVLENTQNSIIGKNTESSNDLSEKYRLIALNTSDLIAFTTFDVDPIFTYVSPSHKKILGFEVDDLIGKSGLDFIHEDDKQNIMTLLLAYIDAKINDVLTADMLENAPKLDFRFRDKSGQWHFLRSTVDIVNDELLFISKDITEQKQAEEALHRSEEMFFKAFRLSPESITLTSLKEGRYVDVNESFLQVIGYSRDEVIGRTATELNIWVDPNDRARFIHGLKEHGSIRNLELCMRTKSGGVGTVLMSSEIITINGEPCALTVTTNITDRKRNEETLRENEQRMKSIIQGLSIAAFVIGSDHQVLYWNKALEELSNIGAEEIIGTTNHWKAFYTQERPCMADILIDGGLDDIEKWYAGRYKKSSLLDESFEATDFFPNLGNDGKWLRFTATVIRNTNGDLISILETLEDISERKKAEEALRETGERFRLAISSITDILYEWNIKTGSMQWFGDIDFRLGYQNETFPRTIEAFLKHVHPDDVNNVQAVATNGLKSHQKWQGEYRVFNKDGAEFYWYGTGIGLYDQAGNPVKVVGAVTDITERKKAEYALHRSEEQYRLVTENASDVIWTMDLNLRFTYFSPSNEKLTGYTTEKALTLSLDELLTSESVERALQAFTAQMELENNQEKDLSRSVTLELNEKRADGTIFPIEVRMCFMRDAQNNPVGILGITRDITVRKQMELSLKESEEKYRSIVENTQDVIMLTAPDGRVSYMSPACVRVLEYNPDELVGKIPEIFYPDDVEKVHNALSSAMQGVSGSNFQYRILTKNGKTKWVSHSWSPILTENHELKCIASIVRDITESKIAEQLLKQKIEELEKYKSVTVNREVKMVDLKNEINELCKQLNQKPKYPSV
jgi:PAS domain S-box-containing protein